jgi:hypothetical protein
MKTKILTLVSFLFLTVVANGQESQWQNEKVKTVMATITGPLKLDASQLSRTRNAFAEFYRSQEEARDASQASGKQPERVLFQKMLKERDKKLKAIFTAAQYTKFKNDLEDSLRPQFQKHEGF